jgi:hypothetical protein
MSRGYAIRSKLDQSGKFGPLADVLKAMEALLLPLKEASPHLSYEVRRFSQDGAGNHRNPPAETIAT